ncbi:MULTISPECIES: type II toxin-antitoxin system ParD family antitoxin [Pseudomonadota]|jgi:antitoxin ParD1/3/4|uniref:type II toxin-antitoxin system ParD family antitoxin n=1 Tax=Pseudomonadota TaxID=1224 RepID=UPI00076AB035|nr:MULTISPECIES: type II toxin-antitoxin system ParD family antitoxin [Pseudomonadota]MAF62374.1 type II toxin-antitoxin system ParD family antitoxin [Blastomonas sp.]MBA4779695.1 type II toxin-antitoxin system ParD family antitoxin [Blastomonas sp.]|tara:strand:- start:418 stop:645 length:228 start_codon:yes stop_codon:yes gene_type:complete
MNVSIGERWEGYVEALLKTGRYASASEVIREGLRLVEERETKLAALRETVDAAIAEDKWYSLEEVEAQLEADLEG